MIIKNLTRRNGTGSLMKYLFRYILSDDAQLFAPKSSKPFIMRHNVKGRSIEEFTKEFKHNEKHRIHKHANQIAINHTILSWSDEDAAHITDAMLRAMVKEYIRLRGNTNLYVFAKHTNTKSVHLHCAMSATKLDGYSSRMSKRQFAELKLSLDAFQRERYPILSHSLPAHGKSKENDHALDVSMLGGRSSRLSQKELLSQTVKEAIGHAPSLEAFVKALRSKGYKPYYRNQKLTGIKLEAGRKFRFRTLDCDVKTILALDTHRVEEAKTVAELRGLRVRSRERELIRNTGGRVRE